MNDLQSQLKAVYQKNYSQLNPAQKQAVDAIEGAVMVIAGPGTGKTQMLTLRIANILQTTQAGPENILALTFTESGVVAMRKRLVAIIGPLAYRVNIFTFHGFANHCILTHTDKFMHLVGASAITEVEQIEILETIFRQNKFAKIKSFADPFVYLSAVKTAITELKRENITPDKFAQILETQKQDLESQPDLYYEKGAHKGKMRGSYKKTFAAWEKNTELLQVYRLYQEELQKRQMYDYEDMLLELIAMLETNEDFRLELQEQYQYFLIDEHQDTNQAQNRIIELLASYYDNPNVFAVGDEKQAIYRFQGASLTNFLYLKQRYPQAQVISLSANYRSTQTILDTAHSLVQHLPIPDLQLPLRDNLVAQSQVNQTAIQIVETADYYGEYYFVAEDIKKALAQDIPAQEIAILARTNADLHEMMAVLKQKQIPFVLRASQNILEDLSIQKLVNLLRLVIHPGEDRWLLKSLVMDLSQVHPLDTFRLQSIAGQANISIWQALVQADLTDPNWTDASNLGRWRDLLLSWITAAQNQLADEAFRLILDESGLLAQVVSQPDLVEGLDRLINLFRQLRIRQQRLPAMTLADFVSFIDLLEQHNLKINSGVTSGQSQVVQLMTAHGSKGLEFDKVYILNCYDRKWGNSYSRGPSFKLPYEHMGTVASQVAQTDANADERRLFYVAITRARTHVTISYARNQADGREQIPSQFISELNSDLLTHLEITDFEAEWNNNRQQILQPRPNLRLESSQIHQTLQPVVSGLLETQGFSVSALNNYLSCPWKYFFRNLLRIPQPKTLSLKFGSAIHESISRWIKTGHPSEQQLVKYFEEALAQEPLAMVDKEELNLKGKEILPSYYHQKMRHWPQNIMSELKISGVGLEPDIKLVGKLDLVVPITPKEVKVVDFKTGKPKSRNFILGKNKQSNGDYFRQLVFYKLLLDRYQSGRYQMVEGVLDFVQPSESGKLKSETFAITAEQTQELEAVIKTTAQEIRQLTFWDKFCDDPACEYCDLRKLMER